MATARKDVSASPNPYLEKRNANVAAVHAKIKELNLRRLAEELNGQHKKRKKRTHTVVPETEARNLRPRPQRDPIENNAHEEIDEDNLDCEPIGDFLCANNVQNSPHQKRQGRGISRMKEVFARTSDMPKVKVILNDHDQPIGSTSRELASVIGCLARKISVQHSDWRLVDFETVKVPLWKDIKAKHEVQPNAAPSHQCISTNVLPTVRHDVAQEVQPNAAQAKPMQPKVGMNVILYGIVRSDAAVAIGTIMSTNPKTVIGGVALGKQYCEVIVNHVLKKDAALPRTYPGVEKMGDADKLQIAWPYNKLKVQQQTSNLVRKASKLPQGVSGGRERPWRCPS